MDDTLCYLSVATRDMPNYADVVQWGHYLFVTTGELYTVAGLAGLSLAQAKRWATPLSMFVLFDLAKITQDLVVHEKEYAVNAIWWRVSDSHQRLFGVVKPLMRCFRVFQGAGIADEGFSRIRSHYRNKTDLDEEEGKYQYLSGLLENDCEEVIIF